MERRERVDPKSRIVVSGEEFNYLLDRLDRMEHDLRPRKSLFKKVVEYGTLFIIGMAGLGLLATYSPIAAFAFHQVSTVLSFALGTVPGWLLTTAAVVGNWARNRDKQGRAPQWYVRLKERAGLGTSPATRERQAPGLGSPQRTVDRSKSAPGAYQPGLAGRVEKALDHARGRERVPARPGQRRVAVGGRPAAAARPATPPQAPPPGFGGMHEL
jgi:hypothetical protein